MSNMWVVLAVDTKMQVPFKIKNQVFYYTFKMWLAVIPRHLSTALYCSYLQKSLRTPSLRTYLYILARLTNARTEKQCGFSPAFTQ